MNICRYSDGETAGTLHTERSYFPSADPTLGPVSRFFEGEATSEVGPRRAAARCLERRDSPNVRDLRKQIAEGDRVFTAADDELSAPSQRD